MASNRMTLEQVIDIFRTRKVSVAFEPMKIDDLVEIVNHFIAMQYIIDNVMKPLNKEIIRRVHYLLVYGTYAERKHKTDAGEYRTLAHQYGISAKTIPTALAEIIEEYEDKEIIGLDEIIEFHVRFERIHPFADYNGRVGRLLLIKECLRNDIEPFIIDDKHRSDYYRGIKQWDKNPNILRNVCKRAQDRYHRQMEVCLLMQYYRPSSSS
jgi:Fic family protein